MARIESDPNYTSPTFSRATAATDLFKKEDVQNLAAAVSTHVHDGVHGLPLTAGSIPNGTITSAMIADATIDTADLKDGAVTSVKILDGTIQGGDIADSAITSAKIADGTIVSTDIAANAVQQQHGAYLQIPSFSTTAVGSYVGTPVGVAVGALGVGSLWRVEWSVVLSHSAAGGSAIVGVGWSGTVQFGLGAVTIPTSGGQATITGVLYSNAFTSVTVQIFVQNQTAGTLLLYGGAYAALYVTEQKR